MNKRNDAHTTTRSHSRTQQSRNRELRWNLPFKPNQNTPNQPASLHRRLQSKYLGATAKEREDHADSLVTTKKTRRILFIEPQNLNLHATNWSSDCWDDEVPQPPPPPPPRTFLDNGQLDPFASLAAYMPQSFINEGVHLSRLCLMDIIGNARDEHGPIFANYILSMAVRHESLMYSMISATLTFTHAARENPRQSPQELCIRSKATRLLSGQMSDNRAALQEFNIWSIVAMAYCSDKALVRDGKLPQQSILRELQSLHIYGRLSIVKAHLQALGQIIDMLGGLHKLSSPQMAAVMSFAGLLESTRELKPSFLPFLSFTNTYLENDRLTMSNQERVWAEPVLGSMGSSFIKLWAASEDGTIILLLKAICHMCDFTIVVNNYLEGRSVFRTPAVMTDQRNFTQYTLMALPTSSELQRVGRQCDKQYESCRLACIIYSFLVIFPLPPIVGLFERLTAQLQNSLFDMQTPHELDIDRIKLQIWILTMGAIIATGLPERNWFLLQMGLLLEEVDLRDVGEFLRLLGDYLWHANTSARDGMEVWHDLQLAV